LDIESRFHAKPTSNRDLSFFFIAEISLEREIFKIKKIKHEGIFAGFQSPKVRKIV
jgi:hypothetical protein